ncbi:MAG: sigma-70 family RNA polymerase sigma factor [Cyanobacteriota bacterium]|nr:sigma-70 family RNA polymerase sigma factor [Cyanobacteriota bacterium]
MQPTHQLNRVLLEQLHRCRQPQRRLRLRNQLVLANLGLVHRVAASQRGKGNLGYEDLVSVGCIGLIKAIETFEPQRGLSLSTVAVPFIRGAMQQEERDRNQPIKTPRRLRELQQRVSSLQQQRHGLGLPPLGETGLASALGCRLEQLREAGAVQRALRLSSLDAPLAGSGSDSGGGLTLLDLVSDAIAC